jgi:hypothetical protein
MDSENIDEVVQEGGAAIGTSPSDTVVVSGFTTKTILNLWNMINNANLNRIRSGISDTPIIVDQNNDPINNSEGSIPNRPLLLSDLMELLNPNSDISIVFNALPIAQYKHLPDPRYLLATARSQQQTAGNVEESTLDTQEVSLPTEIKEEDLPSLDVVEPSSVGGSYKWSSHKKRKSTRTRTKKNKKI